MEVIRYLISLLFLGICSYTDMKTKRISMHFCCVFFVIGLFLQMCEWEFSIRSDRIILFAVRIAVGLFILGVSVLTKGKIGTGDGIVLMVVGTFLSFSVMLMSFVMALLLANIYGGYLLVVKKKKMCESMAFIPFVFCGVLIMG